jgi:hypothetical protein
MRYSGKGSPSSGFVGTWLLLQLCGRVDVYGVGLGGPAQGTVNDQDTFVPPAWRRRSRRLRRSLLMTETTPATTRARRSSAAGSSASSSGGSTPSGASSGSGGGGSLADSANSRGSATSFHYFERRNYRDSREFGDQPHHSWDLEHDALEVCFAPFSPSSYDGLYEPNAWPCIVWLLQVLHGAGFISHVVPPVRSWREERRILEESMESIRKGACDAEIRDKYGELVVIST